MDSPLPRPLLGCKMDGIVKRVAVTVLLLTLIGVAGCGDDEPAQPPVKTTPAVSEITTASLVGLWDDGLDGENTKLDLRADGSAHIVSMAVVPAAWTLDADSLRVTITSRRQADGSTVTQYVTYKPGDDVLTGRFSGPSGPKQVFRRASKDAIAGWSGLRLRLEAEEARRSGR